MRLSDVATKHPLCQGKKNLHLKPHLTLSDSIEYLALTSRENLSFMLKRLIEGDFEISREGYCI